MLTLANNTSFIMLSRINQDERYRNGAASSASTSSSDIKSEISEAGSPHSSNRDDDDELDFADKYPDLPDSETDDADAEGEEEIDPGSHDDELKFTKQFPAVKQETQIPTEKDSSSHSPPRSTTSTR